MKKFCLLGLLVCPLIWTDLFFTMTSSKVLFLQLLIGASAILSFKEGLNLNRFIMSLVVLLLWASVSSFWATDPLLSWSGQYWRGTGLIFYFSVLFLLLTQKANQESKELLKKSFLYLAFFISAITSIHFVFYKGSPSYLFTGNQNATALILGLAILLSLKDQLFSKRSLNSIYLGVLIIGLFLTVSRSALLSLILCSGIYCFTVRREILKKLIATGVGIFGLGAVYHFFINSEFLTDIFLKTRNFSRLKIWPGAFSSFLDKPFTGWGFHGLYDGFWNHYPDSMGSTFQWIDNAHSLPLNVLSELGILGFIILISAVFFFYKEINKREDRLFWISYSLFISAYLLVQPVYIDSIVIIALSYILLSQGEREDRKANKIEMGVKGIGILSIFITSFIQIGQNQDLHSAKAALVGSKDYRPHWRSFLASSPKLIDPQGSLLELSSSFQSLTKNPNMSPSDKKIFSKLILDEFKKFETTSLHRPRYLDLYGVWLMRNNFNEDASDIFDKILKRSPNNSQILILKAESEALRGYQNNALELFEKAELLDPKNSSLKMNLAKLYMELGYREKSIKKIKEASELDPTNLKIKEILKQF